MNRYFYKSLLIVVITGIYGQSYSKASDISFLAQQARTILDNLEQKKIIVEEKKQEALSLYADLEKEVIFYTNLVKTRPLTQEDQDKVNYAEYLLFNLSNHFNLQTPTQKIVRDFKGATQWSFEHITGKAFSSLPSLLLEAVQTDGIKALKLVMSWLNWGFNIPEEIIFKLARAIFGEDSVRLLVNMTLKEVGLTLLSPDKLKILLQELAPCGFDPNSIITVHGDGFAQFVLGDYRIFIIPESFFAEKDKYKNKLDLYRQCGHSTYNHFAESYNVLIRTFFKLSVFIMMAVFVKRENLFLAEFRNLGAEIEEIIQEEIRSYNARALVFFIYKFGLLVINIGVFSSKYLNQYTEDQTKEANNYAAELFKKNGRNNNSLCENPTSESVSAKKYSL